MKVVSFLVGEEKPCFTLFAETEDDQKFLSQIAAANDNYCAVVTVKPNAETPFMEELGIVPGRLLVTFWSNRKQKGGGS